jgi:hypothetical protein
MSQQPTPCDKNSCLWRLRKTTILAEDMCAVCKMMEGKTRTYFKRNKIETKQVCHQLYPNLLVVAQHENGHRNEPLPQVDEDQENRRPKRKHAAIERYEACPSRESQQMYNDRSDQTETRKTSSCHIMFCRHTGERSPTKEICSSHFKRIESEASKGRNFQICKIKTSKLAC